MFPPHTYTHFDGSLGTNLVFVPGRACSARVRDRHGLALIHTPQSSRLSVQHPGQRTHSGGRQRGVSPARLILAVLSCEIVVLSVCSCQHVSYFRPEQPAIQKHWKNTLFSHSACASRFFHLNIQTPHTAEHPTPGF